MFWTNRSENAKTGNVPQCYAPHFTCPPNCGHRKAGSCYAACGYTVIPWKRADENGKRKSNWNHFIKWVESIKPGKFWRYGVAGDLPGRGGSINVAKLEQIVSANLGKKGWTYTHKPLNRGQNANAIAWANQNGFTINLSADNLDHADMLYATGVGPVCVSVPNDAPETGFTPQGYRYVTCPAQTRDVSCKTCKLCSNPLRQEIIAFRVHGIAYKRASRMVRKGWNK